MDKDLKVVLLGYMGSGKSTVGKSLSQELKLPFKDLDNEIEKTVGMSVGQIFDNKGELFFRKKEFEILQQLMVGEERFVLALGGGTPCYGRNLEIIHKYTPYTFYMKLSITSLANRLTSEKAQRPLIANIPDHNLQEFIGKHIFERNQFYSLAKQTIECDQKSVEAVVNEVTKSLV